MVERKSYKIIFVLRKFWSFIFAIIYNVVCLVKFILFKDVRQRYVQRKAEWRAIDSLDKLIYFSTNIYCYSPETIFDHDTTEFEFMIRWGDCDDIALMVLKKLKGFGIEANRILLKGKGLFDWHFDVLFKFDNQYCLFNYGYILKAKTLQGVLKKFSKSFFDLDSYCIVE